MKKQNQQKNQENKVYEIDATNQSLGRLAAEATILLRGKNRVDWRPNVIFGHSVIIKNLEQAKFTGNKIEKKIYYHYSGYPGGLKERKLKDLLNQDPQRLFAKIVYGMLPKNKLRSKLIKNLKFE